MHHEWSILKFWQSLIGVQSPAASVGELLSLPSPSPEAPMPDLPTDLSVLRSLAEPAFDPNALRVLTERYLAKKPDGSLETPKEFLWRVASAIARPELPYARAGGRDPEALIES